jgi:outer membrane protein insertion porin family
VNAYQEVKAGKNILVISVVERPIIKAISFSGNSEVSTDDLEEQIKIKEYSILNVNKIKSDILALQKYYEEKGFYLASIDFKIKKINKDNVKLIFKVKEFDKVKVKNITFLGNLEFSDDELKNYMQTKEQGLFSFLSNSGNFKENDFQMDVERIKYFYKSKGYIQINIGSPEITISEDKKWIFITIRIVEGPVFSIKDINFNGEILGTEEKLSELIELKKGEIYSEDLLRKDIQKLTEYYQDEGYAFANVLRTLQVIPGENFVNINFSFEKGRVAYFGKITVIGNTKTRDKVIRRELKIKEGMKYSGTFLRESKENVNRLGFFEVNSVVFKTSPSKKNNDFLDVEISVKERNTGQISLGAGYSSSSKGFLQASVSQNNFRGMGQNLSFSLSLSKQSNVFNLGFTEPYLYDTKWTAGGDLFYTQNDSTVNSYKTVGGDVRVGYPIWEYTLAMLTYKLESVKITDSTFQLYDVSLDNGISSSLIASVIRDKRNNKFEPSSGYYARTSVTYTGIGGDKNWTKLFIEGRYFYSLIGELVLRSRLQAQQIILPEGKHIPRNQKFSLGGSRNLRGFNFEDIGPKQTIVDQSTGFSYSVNSRGLGSFLGTIELEHPLIKEAGLKWVVFADVGEVFNQHITDLKNAKLNSDYGFGFRWFSPIGVMRFEFGYPITKDSRTTDSQFHFDIGQLF